MTNLSAIHSKPENKRIEPANIGGVQNEQWPNWPAMMDSPQGGRKVDAEGGITIVVSPSMVTGLENF